MGSGVAVMNARRLFLTAAAVALAAPLAACGSQIDALGPVSGDGLTGVRTAATDILMEEGYNILRAPVCTQVANQVTCEGSLVGGASVAVTADVTSDPFPMTLTVDGEVIFNGDVQTVLDRAAQRTSGAD
jgi:hypothetical protein